MRTKKECIQHIQETSKKRKKQIEMKTLNELKRGRRKEHAILKRILRISAMQTTI